MDVLQLIARVLHVGLGVFWAGTIFFMVFLLEPSVRAVGPDGGKVMMALQKKHLLTILPSAAALTVISGLYLLWRSSGGFSVGWFGTSFGTVLTIGAVASIIGFVIGVFNMRPASLKVGVLASKLAVMEDESEREATITQIKVLKNRVKTLARWVAFFLAIAVVTMAAARYM